MYSLVRVMVLIFSALTIHQAHSFANPVQFVNRHYLSRHLSKQHPASTAPLQIPRGGFETELNMIATPALFTDVLYPTLQSGPYGVVALTAVAAAAVVPLTIYKQLYSISVGYGMAIFLIGGTLQLAFQPTLGMGQAMIAALMFYGFRLASYLLLRDVTRKTPPAGGMKQSPALKRLPLAFSVSLFYAFLTVPGLYTLRNIDTLMALPPTSLSSLITEIGVGLAFTGAILEAVADLQKYLVKQFSSNDKKDQFVGPTGGTFRICRHPNYLGEILFWAGVFVGGAPSFGKSIIAWVSSILGLFGIVSIMTKATARLEGQQQDKYSGQENYDKWVKKVKSPLFPFL